MIQTAYFAALRLGEVCGLTWGQVNYERNVLVIDRQLGKDGEFGTPKGGETGEVPFADILRKVLTEQRHALVQRYGFGAVAADKPVFPNTYGDFRRQGIVDRAFRQAREKAELSTDPRALSFHDLRHSCASRLANDPGAVLPEVQAFLRHKNLNTTLSYIHRLPEADRAARFEEALALYHRGAAHSSPPGPMVVRAWYTVPRSGLNRPLTGCGPKMLFGEQFAIGRESQESKGGLRLPSGGRCQGRRDVRAAPAMLNQWPSRPVDPRTWPSLIAETRNTDEGRMPTAARLSPCGSASRL
jgi:hypothetical protein